MCFRFHQELRPPTSMASSSVLDAILEAYSISK